jgi:wobble nucleotide-excising tRNase
MSRSQNKIRKEMSEENMSKQQLDTQAAELKNCNDLIKELVALLEYEEAMTIDPRSQQKMSAKLIELGLWPSR